MSFLEDVTFDMLLFNVYVKFVVTSLSMHLYHCLLIQLFNYVMC